MNISDLNSDQENYLLRRSGFGDLPLVLLTRCQAELSNREQATYNDYDWTRSGTGTIAIAHKYINEHWDKLYSGDVIDVRPIPRCYT